MQRRKLLLLCSSIWRKKSRSKCKNNNRIRNNKRGDSILFQTEKRTIENRKELKTISKYIFYDDNFSVC